MEILKELWAFLRARKKLWLAPIIIVMLILGGLTQGGSAAESRGKRGFGCPLRPQNKLSLSVLPFQIEKGNVAPNWYRVLFVSMLTVKSLKFQTGANAVNSETYNCDSQALA